MKTLNSAVGILEVSSPALGYRALDQITQDPSIEILEASLHGSKIFSIIARGEKSQLETAVKKASGSVSSTGSGAVRDSIVIDAINPKIIETYFALHTTELEESLLVVEIETLSGLFEAAQKAISGYKLNPIEIRDLRGDNPIALGFFTGTYTNCSAASEAIRLSLSNHGRTGTAEAIQNPTETFRNFFNLSN